MQRPEEFGGVILPPWLRDAQNLHRVGFELRVPLPAPLREISSPSHRIVVRHEADPEAVVRLATGAALPNRDLVLEVKLRQPLQGLVGGAAETGPGGFAVMIPSAQFGEVPPQSRRVVFVLDRSGSMQGAPLEQARRAVEACLGACSDEDAFSLVAFDHTVMSFSPHLQPASRVARDQARQWLADLFADGGTELLAGVRAAANVLGPEGGDLLVLTDGQVAGTEDILEALPRSRVRLHCLGIGSASQDRFLSQLTRETGGQCRFLTPRERVDLAVLELFAHLAAPLAWNLRLQVKSGSTATSVRCVSAPPPCVFAGAPRVVQGETDAPARVTLHLEWEAPTGPRRLELPLELPTDSAAGTVWLLQGARRITDAESRLSAADLLPPLDQRRRKQWQCLAALSAHDGLASRAMALVAVVQRRSDRPGELPHTLVVPVGMPEDTAFSAYFLQAPPPPGIMHLSYPAPPELPYPSETRDVQYDAEESLAEPAPSQRVRETRPGGLDLDLVLALATRIEADGGLPGPDEEQRWLASALAVLCSQAAAADQAVSAFELHLQHLLRFLRRSPLTHTDPRKAAWLARAECGEIQLRDPWAWLRRLLRGERISPAEFWAAFRRRRRGQRLG